MTIGQASELATLNTMIKWSLLAMIIVLAVAIAQYSAYQPWWTDPIGRTIVLLEILMLIEVIPEDIGQFFVHSVDGTIRLAYIAVVVSMLVTLALVLRIVTWYREKHKNAG